MASDEDIPRATAALAKVQASGRELEEVRHVLVRRAAVALAAGADERSVAAAAGVQVPTLRRWLTALDYGTSATHP
ncbi:hypothetical protein GCM10009584_14260 [Ornithinimicrobium humiphilum]